MRRLLPILFLMLAAIPGLLWAADDKGKEKVLVVDNFEGDGPKVGNAWEASCDDKGLGTKITPFQVEKGGSPQSPKACARLQGHIGKQKDPSPWAALAIYMNADAPLDLSEYKAMRFHVKGDGKKYRVILARKSIDDYCDYEFNFDGVKDWTLVTAP